MHTRSQHHSPSDTPPPPPPSESNDPSTPMHSTAALTYDMSAYNLHHRGDLNASSSRHTPTYYDVETPYNISPYSHTAEWPATPQAGYPSDNSFTPASLPTHSYPHSSYSNANWSQPPVAVDNTTLSSDYSSGYVSAASQAPQTSYQYNQYAIASYSNPSTDTTRHISPSRSVELLRSPYPASVNLSSPRTPESYGDASAPAPSPSESGESSSLVHAQPQAQGNQQLYTHREQLHFFREALKLPFTVSPSPFVPQSMYKPHTNSDRRRYVEEVELDPPIYFWAENPTECGISLTDALHSRVRRLAGREQTVFEGRGPSVSIRLEWPGYRQWSRQIPTKDFRSPPGPITKAKLAKNVAKCVQRFILERQNQRLEDETDQRWRVGGPGTPYIKLEDLVLVSMHHVSMGSWQPHLRVCRQSHSTTHWP